MIVTAVFSGFGLALAAPWLSRAARGATGWIIALLPLGILAYFISHASQIAAGQPLVARYPWAPNLGVNLSFFVDGLSLLFALLITGIGALVVIYSGGYLAEHQHLGRFYAFLLLFMASMLGLVLADNILALFIFWELTSISSYLLIGFSHEKEASRAAALQALLVTGGGGLALLAGLLLLGLAGGSYELSTLLTRADRIHDSPYYTPILLLALAGAFTKSAQVPFHFWLPGAMEAPTPVSAYLHSATMVKAGIYLLARMSPILGGTSAWTSALMLVGASTMVIGGYLALYQTDLKRILAYSTISALGTLTLLLGLGTTSAIKAAMVFLLAHALYKGALFMVAGVIDHETGTRDVEHLRGLRRTMPLTTVIAGLAAVSLAGFGPVVSFIGKELLFEAVLEEETANSILVSVVVLGGSLFVAVAMIVGFRPFFGEPQPTPREAHEAPLSLWLGPALLAGGGLIIGVTPGVVAEGLIAPSASAVLGHPETVDLYLWHGFNPALILSILSVLAGLGLYAGWEALRRKTSWMEIVFAWGPSRWYGATLMGIQWLARKQTSVLQSGYLRSYLLVIMLTTVALVGTTLVVRQGLPQRLPLDEIRFYEVGIAALIFLAALGAIFARSRLSAVAALGVVGYGVALLYILYSAPDLAMTQVLIETLTVILFVLVFYHLPPFSRLSTQASRVRDAIVATALGALVTLLMLAATATPPESGLAAYFVANSKPVAHGSNIVNVILIDFRGLDTLGEITVLAVAAVGVFALIKLRPSKGQQQ